MTIGELAARTGVTRDTIRFYERAGVLQKPRRRSSGEREYGPDTVRVLFAVRGLRDLGFSLDEISDLLKLGSGRVAAGQGQAPARLALQVVSVKMRRLSIVQGALAEYLQACERGAPGPKLSLVEALEERRPSDDDPAAGG